MVDEAKHAIIAAAFFVVHEECAELQPDIGVFVLVDHRLDKLRSAVTKQRDALVREVKTVVEHVVYLVAVY